MLTLTGCNVWHFKNANIDFKYHISVMIEICYYYYNGCLLGSIHGYRTVLPEEKLSR